MAKKTDRTPVENAAIAALIAAHDELERQIDVAIDAHGEDDPIVDRLCMARDLLHLLHLDITDLRHRRTPSPRGPSLNDEKDAMYASLRGLVQERGRGGEP